MTSESVTTTCAWTTVASQTSTLYIVWQFLARFQQSIPTVARSEVNPLYVFNSWRPSESLWCMAMPLGPGQVRKWQSVQCVEMTRYNSALSHFHLFNVFLSDTDLDSLTKHG